MQVIKAALAIKLKEQLGVGFNISARDLQLNKGIFAKLSKIGNLHLFAKEHTDRLGVFSFYIDNAHYNLITKLLNDRFGIQTRGGSCEGTYGHYLLYVNKQSSKVIEQKILEGCLMERPGWVRMSIHPTMTNEEIDSICDAIQQVWENFALWGENYKYDDL